MTDTSCPECDAITTLYLGGQDYRSQDGNYAEDINDYKCQECGVTFRITFISERKVTVFNDE